MAASQAHRTFSRAVYRDFTLFALAAIGVGLAVSLTLATAIVLAAPSRDAAADGTPLAKSPQRALATQAS